VTGTPDGKEASDMTERMILSMLKNEPEVLMVSEAAKILRIGKNKAYDLIKNGKLSSIKMGGKIIVPKMCLVRFLTDTDNFQMSSRIVSDNPWTSTETCDMIGTADSGTGRRAEIYQKGNNRI
jgi:excisionase family DNA binding protein